MLACFFVGWSFRRFVIAYAPGSAHCFLNMPTTPDDHLFKHQPKQVRILNEQARREKRAQERYSWATQNPTNPKVAGKRLTKPV